MRNYLKLVDFELGRFMRLYFMLIAITVVSQITGVIVVAKHYMKEVNESLSGNFQSVDMFIEQNGVISLTNVTQTLWFVGPITLCVVSLLIYVFFIWYRDWFGKNTFIYRLLMLPTERLNVYLSKASAIFLMVLGLISIQIVLIPIERMVLKWLVPTDFRIDVSIKDAIRSLDYLEIMIPNTFIDLLFNFGIGFMAVFVAFTVVLFERSYRVKGILLGVLYVFVSFVILFSPVLIDAFILNEWFYPGELFILEVIAGVIVTAIAIWTGKYLLDHKIRV